MEIHLDKRAVRQIRLSAADAIEEGDTEALREDILEAFTEEQVEEIERRIDSGDFFEFLTDVLDEWSGDDVDELFELLETQLGDLGVDLKYEPREEDEEEVDDDADDLDDEDRRRRRPRDRRRRGRGRVAPAPRRESARAPAPGGGALADLRRRALRAVLAPFAPELPQQVVGARALGRRRVRAELARARHVARLGELGDEAPGQRARHGLVAVLERQPRLGPHRVVALDGGGVERVEPLELPPRGGVVPEPVAEISAMRSWASE